MDDLEKDYKIEFKKKEKKSLTSLLLPPFIIHSFFKIKIYNSSLNI
jgi:hypothetical protein